MINLDQTDRKLQAVLGGSVSTNQLKAIVGYRDRIRAGNVSTPLPKTQITQTNNTTDVDICGSPERNDTVREIEYISVRNRDTASVTITFKYDDNGTDAEIYAATLAVGDFLSYTSQAGWQVFDSSGRIKQSAGVSGPSSSTDNAIARFDGTSGGILQNSGVTIDDSNNVTGIGTLTTSGAGTIGGNLTVNGTANMQGGVLQFPSGVAGLINQVGTDTLTIRTNGVNAATWDSSQNTVLAANLTANGSGTNIFTGEIRAGATAKTAFRLVSAGTYYGKIQNDSADQWSLAYGTANNDTLGTPTLTWTPAGVAVAGTLTVSGATSAIGNSVSSSTNLNLSAGTTGISSLRIPHGSAPTSPVDGDVWTTSAGLYVRINGSTVGPLS